MNQEIKAEWVEALRSGEYNQDTRYLRSVNGYCCLGVLCEIAVQHEVIGKQGNMITRYGPDGDVSTLPREVQEWAGLDSPNPYVEAPEGFVNMIGEERGHTTLAEINDNRDENNELRYDFNVIADIIDAQLLERTQESEQ